MKRALQEFIFSNPKSQVPSTFCFIWERVNDTSAKKNKMAPELREAYSTPGDILRVN